MGRANVFLVRWDGGWLETVGGYGSGGPGDPDRCEAKLELGALQSAAEASRVSIGQLRVFGTIRHQVDIGTVPITDDVSPYVTGGYNIGDRVTVPDADDAPTTQRAASITVNIDDDTGIATVTPAFVPPGESPGQQLILDPVVAMFQAVKKMINGTMRGQSKVAQPHSYRLVASNDTTNAAQLIESFDTGNSRVLGPEQSWDKFPAGVNYYGDGAAQSGTDDGVVVSEALTTDGGVSGAIKTTGGGTSQLWESIAFMAAEPVTPLVTDDQFAQIQVAALPTITAPVSGSVQANADYIISIGVRLSSSTVVPTVPFAFNGGKLPYAGVWAQAFIESDSSGSWVNAFTLVRLHDDGTSTLIDGAGFSPGALPASVGNLLRVEAIGTSAYMLWNGSFVASGTGASAPFGERVGISISAIGITGFDSGPSGSAGASALLEAGRFDNFSAGDL